MLKNTLGRKLNIKKHFANQIANIVEKPPDPDIHSGLKNQSVFNPQKGSNHHIEVFRKMVQDEIRKLPTPPKSASAKFKQGIKSIEKNKQIVVRPADKGGGLVILNREYYYGEMQLQLEDNKIYKRMKGDPTSRLKEELSAWVNEGSNNKILTSQEANYLVPHAPRVPVKYPNTGEEHI